MVSAYSAYGATQSAYPPSLLTAQRITKGDHQMRADSKDPAIAALLRLKDDVEESAWRLTTLELLLEASQDTTGGEEGGAHV